MRITDIKESGTSSLLKWALSNKANIRGDQPLLSLINDELFYSVTLSDVNFFELFRLSQHYRDKLRILNSTQAQMPPEEELREHFKGEVEVEGEQIPLYEVAIASIERFLNLVAQMTVDSDIIPSSAVRMFIPMISRKYEVQIPVSFYDIFSSMNDEEISEIYNDDYPNTLQSIINADVHGAKTFISINFVKATQIVRYDKRYDMYLNTVKYFPIKGDTSDRLFKLGILGFFKRDPISRTEVRLNLFKFDKETGPSLMKRLARLNTPLEVDLAINLPLEYMQILANSFGLEVLPFSYESSMSNILSAGLTYNDFKVSEWSLPPVQEDEESIKRVEEHEANVSAYKIRIAEANETLLKAVQVLLDTDNDVNTASIFALLPSAYTANAIVTVNSETFKSLAPHQDPLIASLFNAIQTAIGHITDDLRKARD